MSTPPHLDLAPGVRAVTMESGRGRFAALEATPVGEPHGTAVLVPGFTGSKEDFIALLGPLRGSGYRVVAYDQRGQHETPGPDTAEAYSLDGFAADLLALAESLSAGPVHVVGHSFGGLVARAAALAAPSALASLTLMDSGPAALGEAAGARLRLFAEVMDAHGLEVVWAAKQALDAEAGAPAPDDPRVAEFLRRRFLGNAPASLRAMVAVLVGEVDRTDELAATGLPVLVLFGESDDAWSPRQQEEMAVRLGARPVRIDGAAHSPNAERPLPTAAALAEFWGAGPGHG